MSAGNENLNETKESLASSGDGESVGAKEDNVETPTRDGINPNKIADPPQSQSGGGSPGAPRGGGGGGGGSGKGKPGGGGGGGRPSEADSVELFTNWAEFIQFIKETYIEFRKISWPTRQQVLQETWSVIVLVALLTCSVLAFDWVIAKTVFEPLDKYAKHVGGGVGRSTQNWSPAPVPESGAPTNQPGVPANSPATPASSPEGQLNKSPVPTSAPAGTTPATPGAKEQPSGTTTPSAPAGSSTNTGATGTGSSSTPPAKPSGSK